MNVDNATGEDTSKPAPPAVAATPAVPDKLAPFRALFGMPVAVQFAAATPYIQIAPQMNRDGSAVTVPLPGTKELIGLPAVAADQQQATAVALGVLRASECGTWLVIEERLGLPRTAETLGGQALMDVYVRPEMVTHVSFVKAVDQQRPYRGGAEDDRRSSRDDDVALGKPLIHTGR